MAGRDNNKALPSGSVKRTKDNNSKAAVKDQASSSGDAKKPNSVQKPIMKIYYGKSNEV